jgi:hypothetical protein
MGIPRLVTPGVGTFVAEPVGVVACGDEELAGGVVTDTVHRDERGGDIVEDCFDAPAEFADLGSEGLPAACHGGERVTRRAVGRGGVGGPPAGSERDLLRERQVP